MAAFSLSLQSGLFVSFFIFPLSNETVHRQAPKHCDFACEFSKTT